MVNLPYDIYVICAYIGINVLLYRCANLYELGVVYTFDEANYAHYARSGKNYTFWQFWRLAFLLVKKTFIFNTISFQILGY